MKIKYIIIILLPLVFSGCASWMAVLVKIIDLEKEEEFLEIEFSFKDRSLENDVAISNIMIFKNDTLHYKLEPNSDTTNITQWHFPHIPKGFKIVYPKNEKIIEKFNRTDNFRFEFTGQKNKKGLLGEWIYKPSYLNNENRWMFDSEGNKIVNIESSYESWVGKDVIKIYSNADLNIDMESLKLINHKDEKVTFEIKSKKDNNKIVVLTLEHDIKKGEILNLEFKTKEGNSYRGEVIFEKGGPSVGLIGKYR